MRRGKETITRLTFIGEPSYIPDVGESIQIRTKDGSWLHGFRCISGVVDGEIWVSTELEWNEARRETRPPKGDKWPISQVSSA